MVVNLTILSIDYHAEECKVIYLISLWLLQDESKKSKGFGFINFENAEEAAVAVEKNQNSLLEGKEIWCGRAQKKSEREAELKQKWVTFHSPLLCVSEICCREQQLLTESTAQSCPLHPAPLDI